MNVYALAESVVDQLLEDDESLESSEFLVKGSDVIRCRHGHWVGLNGLGFVEPHDISGGTAPYKRAAKAGWSRVNIAYKTAWVDPNIPKNVSSVINLLADHDIEVQNERPMRSDVLEGSTMMELSWRVPDEEFVNA